jgi:hypothetical protein
MISFTSCARLAAVLIATSAVGGVAPPVLEMEHIVMNVEESLKGTLPKGQIRALWMGPIPRRVTIRAAPS